MAASVTTPGLKTIKFNGQRASKVSKWKVAVGGRITQGLVLMIYDGDKKLKSNVLGTVAALVVKEGEEVQPGMDLLQYQGCLHAEVMKDLCAECGEDLRQLASFGQSASKASVSMVHSVPELKVSLARAEQLGKADEDRLLVGRKLVLLVDLDQTIIHTTNDNVQNDLADVHHFQLYGSNSPWYHTKLRPHTMDFLEKISPLYELHICTFGARKYAHTIANLLDADKKFFSHRILSRDECLDPTSKTGNLKALFPCGDSLVCIIDDREDVWSFATNLIAVKPYLYFRNTGDINSPFKSKDSSIFQEQVKYAKQESDQAIATVSQVDPDAKVEDGTVAEMASMDMDMDIGGVATSTDEKPLQVAKEENEEVDEKGVEKQVETKVELDMPKNEQRSESVESKATPKDEDTPDVKVVISELDDEDDYLLYLNDVLRKIHQEFYTDYDNKQKHLANGEQMKIPDLKEVIPRVRRMILSGVNIVFSGVIPTNQPIEKSKLLMSAKAMGANVSNDVVFDGSPLEKTTHVVATKYGTAKVNKAQMNKKILIVTPSWLYCCAERWERVDERLFILEKDESQLKLEKNMANDASSRPSHPNQSKPSQLVSKGQVTEVQAMAVYDPVTGKRVRKENVASVPIENAHKEETVSGRDEEPEPEPHHMLDFSPLSNFSSNDLQLMGKEVDDACSEGDERSGSHSSSHSSEGDLDALGGMIEKRKRAREESSSEEEGLSPEYPKGWTKKDLEPQPGKRICVQELEEDTRDSYAEGIRLGSDSGSSDDLDSVGSDDEEMAADLEREFLGCD